MGLRSLEDGYVPPILDVSKLDRKLLVSNEESIAGLRDLLDTEGDLRRRLRRRCRACGPPPRRGARRGCRRLHPRRRRLEVPLGGLLGGRRRRAAMEHGLWWCFRPRSAELRAHAEEEAPNEACGVVVVKDGVAERYVRGHNAAASPYRFELEVPPETVVLSRTTVTSSPSSTRTSPPRPVRRDRRREHRPLARQAVPDPLPRFRLARRLDDPRRSDRAAPRLAKSARERLRACAWVVAVDGAAPGLEGGRRLGAGRRLRLLRGAGGDCPDRSAGPPERELFFAGSTGMSSDAGCRYRSCSPASGMYAAPPS